MHITYKLPVTQETQMEVGVDNAKAICSGKMEGTLLTSLGWLMGRSSLPRRREGSKRRVTGGKGPSRVVGMGSCLVPSALIICIRRRRRQHKVPAQHEREATIFFVMVIGFCRRWPSSIQFFFSFLSSKFKGCLLLEGKEKRNSMVISCARIIL